MALYLEHFGLSEPPFRITPHTDFFFDGADRGATLEALVYAILHDEGIVKVSGEVGSGKTMLCRVLMERLPAHVETIYVATPSLGRDEVLQAIADDLKLQVGGERTAVALRTLQEHLISLYGAGRRVVILIDEAHVIPDESLEQVRLLSNLESNRHKLLQIVLFGQPELDATLAKNSLRQLRDRITHSFRMRPLALAEVGKYLSFRMRAAGYRGPDVFTARAVARIARAAGGLTRRINILADKALLCAYSENTHAVTERHVHAAIRDSEFAVIARPARAALYAGAAALLAGVAIGSAIQWSLTHASPELVVVQPVQPVQAKAVEIRPAPPPAPLLEPDQVRRLGGYSPGPQRLLAERIAATRQVMQTSPDGHYALELFVTENTDPARMERFLLRARDMVPLEDVFVIPMAEGKKYRLRVVLGDFPSLDEALEAEKRLPPKYQDAFRTEPRSFAELRSQI
ncbi:MAG TPA: AAA family ATPase [Burkholderiales bacterium]|nr:AAA family ATPase [Burkholderiales bacterium]